MVAFLPPMVGENDSEGEFTPVKKQFYQKPNLTLSTTLGVTAVLLC